MRIDVQTMFLYPWMKKFRKLFRWGLSGNRTCLTIDECGYLVSLMERGFSFYDALDIIRDKETEKMIDEINEMLAQGIEISEWILDYFPVSIAGHMKSFLACLPFQQSLMISLEIDQKSRENRETVLKELLYPCLLCAGVILGFMLFQSMIYPMLLQISGTEMDGTSVFLMKLIPFLSRLLGSLAMILIIGFLWCCKDDNIVILYQFLCDHQWINPFRRYASVSFIRYYRECSLMHMPTRECLRVMASMKKQRLASFIASRLDERLEKGEKMEDVIRCSLLEGSLARFFRVALYSSDLTSLLDSYLDMMEKKTKAQIKVITKIIQLIAYGMIGIVIIFIYQALFLPMTMLENIPELAEIAELLREIIRMLRSGISATIDGSVLGSGFARAVLKIIADDKARRGK